MRQGGQGSSSKAKRGEYEVWWWRIKNGSLPRSRTYTREWVGKKPQKGWISWQSAQCSVKMKKGGATRQISAVSMRVIEQFLSRWDLEAGSESDIDSENDDMFEAVDELAYK